MTTGYTSYDNFTPNGADGSWLGSKGSVSWSGADQPKSPRTPATYSFIHREVLDKNGRLRIKRYRVRDPGYTQARAKLVDHSYLKSRLLLNHGSFRHTDGRVFADVHWFAPSSWGVANLLDANDQIKLVNRLASKNQGSDFNMSVFLGEGHQTLKLLTDSAIRIAKAGQHIKRLDILGASRSLFEGTSRRPLKRHDWRTNRPFVPTTKTSGNLWLELQYGWLPLLNDAEDCAKSLAHSLNVPFSTTVRASVRKEWTQYKNKDLGQSCFVSGFINTLQRRQIVAKLSEPTSAMASLGLLDPELVAWELVPFSFVADWFIPIGSWMEARGAASRLVGTFITTDKRESNVWGLSASNPVYGVQPCTGRYNQISFTRSISTSLKVPMPVVKPLAKVASWQHCANAIALVTQVFSGKRS